MSDGKITKFKPSEDEVYDIRDDRFGIKDFTGQLEDGKTIVYDSTNKCWKYTALSESYHIDAPEFVSGNNYGPTSSDGCFVYKDNVLYSYFNTGSVTLVTDETFDYHFEKFDPYRKPTVFRTCGLPRGTSPGDIKLVSHTSTSSVTEPISGDTFKQIRKGDIITVRFNQNYTFASTRFVNLKSFYDYDDTPGCWWNCSVRWPASNNVEKPTEDFTVTPNDAVIFMVTNAGPWNGINQYTQCECMFVGVSKNNTESAVSSVNGKTGAVVLNAEDITYSPGVTIKSEIDGKADTSHNHDDVYYTKDEVYTKDKVNVELDKKQDLINESNKLSYNLLSGTPTFKTLNNVELVGTGNIETVVSVNEKKGVVTLTASDINYSDGVTIKNELDEKSDIGHTHDDRYFTETEIQRDYYTKKDVDDGFVKREENKGLSTNDFTDAYKSRVEAAQIGKSFANYSSLVTYFNSLAKSSEIIVGQSLYVNTVEVPDLWVYSIENSSSTYTYTTDQALIDAIAASGSVQMGYYKIARLETAKVTFEDHDTKNTAGNSISTSTLYLTGTTNYSNDSTSHNITYVNSALYAKEGKLYASEFVGPLNGKASSATSADAATKATKDSKDQTIASTYIKNITASGTTVTFTKGDGTTGTFTTQDTNTDTKNTAGNYVDATNRLYLTGTKNYNESNSNSFEQTYASKSVYVTGGTLHASTLEGNLATSNLSGTIYNNQLANKSITIGGTPVDLGGSITADQLKSIVGTSNFKTKQTAKSDPAVTDSVSNEFISSISQDANGEITATKKKVFQDFEITRGTAYHWGSYSVEVEILAPKSEEDHVQIGTEDLPILEGYYESLNIVHGVNSDHINTDSISVYNTIEFQCEEETSKWAQLDYDRVIDLVHENLDLSTVSSENGTYTYVYKCKVTVKDGVKTPVYSWCPLIEN